MGKETFTPEEKIAIYKWLEDNKELMERLAESEELDKKLDKS